MNNNIGAIKKQIGGKQYSDTRLVISYNTKIGKDALLKAIQEYNATIIYDMKKSPIIVIKIPQGQRLVKAIEYFKKIEGVLQVNKDGINEMQ